MSLADEPKLRVPWYRSPVSREDLKRLNTRSDFKAFLQTGGYLALLATTATLSIYSAYHWPWYATIAILFFHGTFWAFLINGFHELVHDSVFKTRWLNSVFLRIFSFLGQYNHHAFWASHTEHHKYTLHPPDDLEVVLPVHHTRKEFFSRAFINPSYLKWNYKTMIRYSLGRLEGQWENHLFPASDPAKQRRLFNWARIVLAGNLLILGVSIYMHWWMLPVVTIFAHCYGGWLHYLCNNSQHVGLQDHVSDFRLCVRTIYLNPFVQFLYWHMNYHTEHHMFAAVPCYNLGKLHRIIKDDLPHTCNGLYETWTHIAWILKKQKEDPKYQYAPELPSPSKRETESVEASPAPVVATAS